MSITSSLLQINNNAKLLLKYCRVLFKKLLKIFQTTKAVTHCKNYQKNCWTPSNIVEYCQILLKHHQNITKTAKLMKIAASCRNLMGIVVVEGAPRHEAQRRTDPSPCVVGGAANWRRRAPWQERREAHASYIRAFECGFVGFLTRTVKTRPVILSLKTLLTFSQS